MSSISSWATIAAWQDSSSSGAATDAWQRFLPFSQHRLHFSVAERAPHDDDDVERERQLAENRAKTLTNQATRATSLHGAADLARSRDPQAQRRTGRATRHDEHQAVAVDTRAAGLNLQVFGALADAIVAGRTRLSRLARRARLNHSTFRRWKPSGASDPCGDGS